MPVKPSRIARSSSLGEIGLFSQVRPIDGPEVLWGKSAAPAVVVRPVQKLSKPSNVKPTQPCLKILTISSPVRESNVEDPDLKVGGFLEACYLCKKKIGEKDEVFMYSYLRAFCSCNCRDQQIALDRGVETSAVDSTEMATLRDWEQKLNGRFGAPKPQIE
ncbi:FCS-Like Zinc finger 17-like [Telopea speciosissima]|uniref:FCS-Like Zinc finger 17-like n=1 Tax=Telopea speciosissima TaxID=54955 RepID=UPI001CC6330E|nr:FCS-Like Zinc finger 17-like [Telopea speciosissima]